jgi:ABC-type glutathione transport system ATPase component
MPMSGPGGPRSGKSMNAPASTGRPLVELRHVVKHFPVTGSPGEIVRGRRPAVHALDGVSLDESLKAFHREAQLVFQIPFDALNLRFTIYRAVAEPLLNAGIGRRAIWDQIYFLDTCNVT